MKYRRTLPIIVATTLLGILVLGLLAAMCLRRLQRAIFYPSPASMPSAVAVDLGAALGRLESALAKHSPRVLDALQPGLSDEEISTIQSEHRMHLTDDLKALYRWRNGSPSGVGVELIPGMRFVSLQEAARMRDEMRARCAVNRSLKGSRLRPSRATVMAG